jgi:hypothetical protein
LLLNCLPFDENRESRSEDLTRIMKLTQLVKAKDEEVRRVNEEMKFFKLEVCCVVLL